MASLAPLLVGLWLGSVSLRAVRTRGWGSKLGALVGCVVAVWVVGTNFSTLWPQ